MEAKNASLEGYKEKEILQQRHYGLLQELQNMSRDLPQKFQQRLPYELLSSLANSLLDGTVFDIVKGLKELQHMIEKNLLERRLGVVKMHKAAKTALLKRQKEMLAAEVQLRPYNVHLTQARFEQEKIELERLQEEEINRTDMKIIYELDQAVSDQQVTLEKAGVPGFYVCNNPNEVRLQMYLLEFITTLSLEASKDNTVSLS